MDNGPVRIGDDSFEVDAAVIAHLLGVSAAELPDLMRAHDVTCLFERGVEDDAGKYRLTFFYRGCRARIVVDAKGRVLRRSAVDYGSPARLRAAHSIKA